MKSLAIFITHITTILRKKNPNENGAHELLEARFIPYHDNEAVDHSQLTHSLLNDVFPGSYRKLS